MYLWVGQLTKFRQGQLESKAGFNLGDLTYFDRKDIEKRTCYDGYLIIEFKIINESEEIEKNDL